METDDTRAPLIAEPRNAAPQRAVEQLPSAEIDPHLLAAYADWCHMRAGDWP